MDDVSIGNRPDMTANDPIATLTSTFSTSDLRSLVERDGPFLTVAVPAPSEHVDAEHRFDVRWGNALSDVREAWSDELLERLDIVLDAFHHGDGEAVAVVQAADGTTLMEQLAFGLAASHARVGDQADLALILSNRQRTIPHIVVETDRAGADIVGFDAGSVSATGSVTGSTEHIHRGHPGGWSQRRFQQRAENTWERNARKVADQVVEMADRLRPLVVALAGDVRATNLLAEELVGRTSADVVIVEAGDAAGIAAEVVRLVDDQHARVQRDALERLREGVTGSGAVAGVDEVRAALATGRIDTLLVTDDDDRSDRDRETIGAIVKQALLTDARLLVVPAASTVADGVAGLTRW